MMSWPAVEFEDSEKQLRWFAFYVGARSAMRFSLNPAAYMSVTRSREFQIEMQARFEEWDSPHVAVPKSWENP